MLTEVSYLQNEHRMPTFYKAYVTFRASQSTMLITSKLGFSSNNLQFYVIILQSLSGIETKLCSDDKGLTF